MKFKRFIIYITVFSMFLCLFAACGGNEKKNPDKNPIAVADNNPFLPTGPTDLETDVLDPSEEVVNVLLTGIDSNGSYCDAIMVFSLNCRTDKLNILSVPRDTMISYENQRYKMSNALNLGYQMTQNGYRNQPEDYLIEKIRNITGLPIHFSITVDYNGFVELVDILGGVDFNVPFRMKYDDPVQNLHIDLNAGNQHLDGEKALQFVRFRQGNPGYQGYAKGDLGRIEAQQAFLEALISQNLNITVINKLPDLFETACRRIRTNLTDAVVEKYLFCAERLTKNSIDLYQVPGNIQTLGGTSYFIADIQETKALVQDVFQK